jgi:hypothetical protein
MRLFVGIFDILCRRAWRAFERDARHAGRVNRKTLQAILKRHRNTEFGRTHGFTGILGEANLAEAFCNRVPLSRYADYAVAMNSMADGARNLLIADRVVFFAPSSGTTGKPKMIPVTVPGMRTTVRALLLSRAVLARILPKGRAAGRGMSLIRMADHSTKTAAGIPTGDASAEGMRRAAWMLPYLYTTPLAGMLIADRPSALFVHLLFGLRERRLNHISATFAHYLVQLFRTLEERWPELLEALASGRLPANLKLSQRERRALESRMRPDPGLAAMLRPEFEKGMEGIAQRVWPAFTCVVAVATGSFEAYAPRLREYIGSALICNLLYGATEASLGVNLRADDPSRYALIPGSCYYEFIPLEDCDAPMPATVALDELEVGLYELVITSVAGFYRYRMDDVLRVVEIRHGNPIVEFAFRRGTILNVAAEKTTEQQVGDVMRELARQELAGGARLVDYTVAADTHVSPPRYRFFFEMESGNDSITGAPASTFARFLDQALAAANIDYAIMRKGRTIGEPVVELLRPGTFDSYLVWSRGSAAAAENTVKIPRLIQGESQLRFFEAHAAR